MMLIFRKPDVSPARKAKRPVEGYSQLHRIADAAVPEFKDNFFSAMAMLANQFPDEQLVELIQQHGPLGTPEKFDWQGFARLYEPILADAFRRVVIQAGRAEAKDLAAILVRKASGPAAVGAGFTLNNQAATDWAKKFAAERVKMESEAIKGSIRDLIWRGFQEGREVRRTARDIRGMIGLDLRRQNALYKYEAQLFEKFPDIKAEKFEKLSGKYRNKLLNDRAESIARTETIAASNQGQQLVWNQAVEEGLIDPLGTMRVWSAAHDERLCPICGSLHGKTATMNGSFPGGYTMPPAHTNCRCAVILKPIKQGRTIQDQNATAALVGVALDRSVQGFSERIKTRLAAGVSTPADAIALGSEIEAEAVARAGAMPSRLAELNNEARRLVDEANAVSRAYHEAKRAGRMTNELANQLADQQDAFLKRREAVLQEARELAKKWRKATTEAYRAILAEIRPMGGGAAVEWAEGSTPAIKKLALETKKNYPSAWWDESAKLGQIEGKVKKTLNGARGYYRHIDDFPVNSRFATQQPPSWYKRTPSEIYLKKMDAEEMASTLTHEFGHRMQRAVPKMHELEVAYFNERTRGELARPLSRFGKAGNGLYKTDKFPDDYMGRIYEDGDPKELFTVAIQAIFHDHYHVRVDAELIHFILGLLAGV